MSKSRGNVIAPDSIVDEIGADAFRMYEMFMGAFDQPIPWSTQGAKGCKRFLDRVWRLMDMLISYDGIRPEMRPLIHGAIKKVGEDYERMKFNTAIAALMSLVNEMYAIGGIAREELHTLLTLLSPVSPHICEEMNELLGYTTPLYDAQWPQYDESALIKESMEYGVQINGKIKARIELPCGIDREETERLALGHRGVTPLIEGRTVRKVIVAKNVINIVVS